MSSNPMDMRFSGGSTERYSAGSYQGRLSGVSARFSGGSDASTWTDVSRRSLLLRGSQESDRTHALSYNASEGDIKRTLPYRIAEAERGGGRASKTQSTQLRRSSASLGGDPEKPPRVHNSVLLRSHAHNRASSRSRSALEQENRHLRAEVLSLSVKLEAQDIVRSSMIEASLRAFEAGATAQQRRAPSIEPEELAPEEREQRLERRLAHTRKELDDLRGRRRGDAAVVVQAHARRFLAAAEARRRRGAAPATTM
uniref:Uncharacterized protein n=2 Tax=Phaeomonas parva TaxID=124430 RepID=A0A7S1UAA9_9STRA|mmetsp:Transcript_38018/g.119346  ORF Transcript_38018/g.119346 Transcript_38018/m.119346 type:complete len:255 (+) Transcript_38018:881-1645(+)